ncbi:propionyl-CoA synthetase [Arthrobacter mangrovi]|uniref:Propionyl-CoA synthetase n=1 Tax=Arthrobacter mangrovi TaxID=2966350 RepID=A0ABQ5MYZ5_9MICC|nr:propionyl-CoA synthetase [Arthrobacter mangrovi]GLB69176.1 propionyl-CoA synthetase [Arthrobacter mangrovi]
MSLYQQAYRASLADPEQFWDQQVSLIDWVERPHSVLDQTAKPLARWFPDGRLNTCFNALDRHVAQGRGSQAAIHYDSPVTGTRRTLTYGQLLDDVSAFAGGLASLGVDTGDRVLIYMPMLPHTAVAMLACARLGAVHCVVFGGFAAAELRSRIEDFRPKVVITASCGIEPKRIVEYKPIVDEALAAAGHRVQRCIVLQRPQAEALMVPGRDIDWEDVHDTGRAAPTGCRTVASDDPLYVLHTSGTTGKPKGIVRDNGRHAVAMAWSMKNIYGIGPGDVWWAASDLGWVVGHSYIVYAPLIAGATTVLYEGKPVGTPDAGAFWRVIQDYQVSGLLTAPTSLRAIRREDPQAAEADRYDLSGLRNLFLAGERLDPETYAWACEVLGIPVTDHWWQTETGWPIAANPRGLESLPVKPGSSTVPVPGYDVRILDAAGREAPANTEGAVCLKLPLPPGTLAGIWGDPRRLERSYLSTFPGYYLTGDGGYIDEDGYVHILGRSDDIINVAGHRLSTGAMEAVLAQHPMVAECAVVGIDDALKGQLPLGLVVLKTGAAIDSGTLQAELVRQVRATIGAVAAFRKVLVVPSLPKTRSGKILRKTLREIIAGQDTGVPPTIENPEVLQLLRPLLAASS